MSLPEGVYDEYSNIQLMNPDLSEEGHQKKKNKLPVNVTDLLDYKYHHQLNPYDASASVASVMGPPTVYSLITMRCTVNMGILSRVLILITTAKIRLNSCQYNIFTATVTTYSTRATFCIFNTI